MTTPLTTDRMTTCAVLFPGIHAAPAISAAINARGAAVNILRGMHGLTHAAEGEVTDEVGRVAVSVLDFDLIDLVVGGWRKHTQLVTAAQRSIAVPESEQLVDLAPHRITSVHRPSIDVIVDGFRVGKIDFVLSVIFDVNALVGVIRAGRLVELRGGKSQVTASLAVEGIELVSRKAHLDLDAEIRVRPVVQLADPAAAIPSMRASTQP